MHVMDKPSVFIANKGKLCISPKIPEIIFDKVETSEDLEVGTIHQESKIPEVKRRNCIGRGKTEKKFL